MKMAALALLATVAAFGFTACSDDDDDQENYYSMGFSTVSYSGSSLTAMSAITKTIEDAYTEAFGGKTFFTYGCDSKVKEACEAAEKNIVIDWADGTGTFVFEVTNATKDNKVVYSKTFTNKTE